MIDDETLDRFLSKRDFGAAKHPPSSDPAVAAYGTYAYVESDCAVPELMSGSLEDFWEAVYKALPKDRLEGFLDMSEADQLEAVAAFCDISRNHEMRDRVLKLRDETLDIQESVSEALDSIGGNFLDSEKELDPTNP